MPTLTVPEFNQQAVFDQANANNPSKTGVFQGPAQEGFGFASPSGATQAPSAPQIDITGAPVLPAQNTQAETLAGIKTEALRIQDILNTRQNFDLSSGQTAEPEFQPFDENKARKDAQRNQLSLYQAEIDATNQVYDQLLNEARLQGQGRLGSQRASAARGGLLGSDFAGSQKNKVQGFNTDINRGIGAERSAAIGAIMGNVRSSVQTEIKDKREARQAGANEYLDFLTRGDERRDNNAALFANDFLSQGQDPSDFSDEELTEMLQGSGVSKADLIRNYSSAVSSSEASGAETALKTRKTEAEIAKLTAQAEAEGFVSIGDGSILYNANTGEQIENPKNFAPKSVTSTSSSFSVSDEQTLLSGGWTEGDLGQIDADVRANGLPAVIENARNNGSSDSEIQALEKAYGAEAGAGEQFLTKEYFGNLFTTQQLEEASLEAGFGNDGEGLAFRKTDTEGYLTYLEGVINAYRQADYSDQEILALMQ